MRWLDRRYSGFRRWATWAGVVAASIALVASALTAGAAAPSNVQTGSVASASFVVTWVSSAPEAGYVQYGSSCGSLNNRADDDRGAAYTGVTHYVRVSGLAPNTDYCYRVVSGGTEEIGTHPVRTGAALVTLPMPSQPVAGTVKDGNGTGLAGALVYVVFVRGDGQRSERLSTYTTRDGGWALVVENARDSSGQPMSVTDADNLALVAEAGPNNRSEEQTVSVGDGRSGGVTLGMPGTATPTDTPAPPTSTPPPTNTPVPAPPTNTPAPGDSTPVPTSTPAPAGSTPVAGQPADLSVPSGGATQPAGTQATALPGATSQPAAAGGPAAGSSPAAPAASGGPPQAGSQPPTAPSGGAGPASQPPGGNPGAASGAPVAAAGQPGGSSPGMPPAAASAAPGNSSGTGGPAGQPDTGVVPGVGAPTAGAGTSGGPAGQAAPGATPAGPGGQTDILQATVAVAGAGVVGLFLFAAWGMMRQWRR